MKKRLFIYTLSICIFFSACSSLGHSENLESADSEQGPSSASQNNDYQHHEYQRFSVMFFDVFDTITELVGYARSQDEFDYFSMEIREELRRLHQLFDIFNEYPDINNMYTINNYAGIAPVEAEPVIIELLQFSIEAYHLSEGLLNIAIGPVTNIWRQAIAQEKLPCLEDLQSAGEFIDISNLIIDEEMGTVFLQQEGMSLDVGAIAKGFAIERVAQAAIDAGFTSFSLTVGGDVRVTDGPRGHRDTWNVGVSNPEGGDVLDIVSVTHTSVFSSGNYLRYFVVDGEVYHHIIDPGTLMSATSHQSVTVVYPHGGMADVLSLVAFILDTDEAMEFLASFAAQGMWVLQDGTVVTTPNWSEADGF